MKFFVGSFLIIISGLVLSGCNLLGGKPEITQLSPTPTISSGQVKQSLESKTAKTLPVDAEQVVLRDVTGGTGSGIASRKLVNQRFELTILADLPELKNGTFYQVWLVKESFESPESDYVNSGKLRPNKGGWLLEFTSNKNLMDHNGVRITLETKLSTKPENIVLSGSF